MRNAWVLTLLLTSCAHGGDALVEPPVEVTIEVNNVDARQRALVEQHVCGLDDVIDCRLEVVDPLAAAQAQKASDEAKAGKKGKKSKKGKKRRAAKKDPPPEDEDPPPEEDPALVKKTGVLRFKYEGGLDHLRHQIAQLPHPGLKGVHARADLRFDGFDNTPPTVSMEKPQPGEVLTSQDVEMIILVPDKDIAKLLVGDTPATPLFEGKWIAHVKLVDGSHNINIHAEDTSGNATDFVASFTIDTTPPALMVSVTKLSEVKVMVKGTVGEDAETLTMDGKPISTSTFGNDFAIPVTIDPDRTKVEIVAVDEYGNEVVLNVPLEDGAKRP